MSGDGGGEIFSRERDETFCYAGDDVAYCVPGTVVDAETVVHEKDKVVVCDAFGKGFMADGSVEFGFELSKVDVDVECIKRCIGGGKSEIRGLGVGGRRRKRGQ